MEDLGFHEALALVKHYSVDFDLLLRSSVNGDYVDVNGRQVADDDVIAVSNSDFNYDRISAYIKILKFILAYRPLPY